MALVTKGSVITPDATSIGPGNRISGLLAGEAIATGDLCRVHTDGTAMLTNATALNASAEVWGIAAGPASIGQPVTLLGEGVRIRYGSSLTVGSTLYAGATAGRLDTAVTTGDAVGVAKVLTSTDILIIRANGKNAA